MTDRETPKLDPRRADEFRRELLERAHAWVRSWNVSDPAGGFGVALVDVAARFNAQVAERLDRAGEKLSLGLLDWLALRGKAARPARVPVAFKLAENATVPVLAPHPVQLQADVDGANVVFETETDAMLVPGRLEQLVAVDAAQDHYFLPPPGLSSLDPLEPLPTQWRLKSFAEIPATRIQLDPALGLAPQMLIQISGKQYTIVEVEGDLVTIEPPLDVAGGVAAGTTVDKVSTFDPFGGAARNQQQHIVYLGDEDLFNIEAAAVLEIHGADTKLSAATWEYFGKAENDDEARWRELKIVTAASGIVTLAKPKGAIGPTAVGKIKSSRWIRARQQTVASESDILSTEALTVIINPGAVDTECPPPGVGSPPGAEAEGFTNTTALVVTSAFYPLGREPRQFDTFFIGCADALSKQDASVSICFELADPAANCYSLLREGLFANRLLVAVGADGALHLIEINGSSGKLSRFLDHEPLQPKRGSTAVGLDPKPKFRLPAWAVNDGAAGAQQVPDPTLIGAVPSGMFGLGFFSGLLGNFFSNPFFVAATAGNEVWVWKEYPFLKGFSHWISFNALPATPTGAGIEGLVYLRDDADSANHGAADVTGSLLFAAIGGKLYKHSAVERRAAERWDEVTLSGGTPALQGNTFKLVALAPVLSMDTFNRWHGTVADGMVGVFSDDTNAFVNFISSTGACVEADAAAKIVLDAQPAALRLGANQLHVFWHRGDNPAQLHAVRATAGNLAATLTPESSPTSASSPQSAIGYSLEIPPTPTTGTAWVIAMARTDNDSYVISWSPVFTGLPSTDYFETPLPADAGPLGGAPTVAGSFIVVPGTQADAWVANWNPTLRRTLTPITLATAVVTPESLAPLAQHDVVASTEGTTGTFAEVMDFGVVRQGERLHLLDGPIGVGATAAEQLFAYRRANAVIGGTAKAANKLQLINGDYRAVDGQWLLIQKPTGLFFLRRITVDPSATPWVVTLSPSPNLNPGDAINYWYPEPLNARLAPAFELTAATGNWDAALLDRVDLVFPDGAPNPQRGKAFRLDQNQPRLVALNSNWQTMPSGATTSILLDAALSNWTQQLGDNTTNPDLIWEYWNGTSWWPLELRTEETLNLKRTGRVAFDVPDDLKPTDVGGSSNHWIRARLIGGDYGRETVKVITKPVGTDGTTEQTVVRTASEFRPPLVVNMRVRYSVSTQVTPTYLLTQDAGSMRNQSDANRTLGALVEAYVPLSVQMRRLETGPLPSAPAQDAGTDCGCNAAQAKLPAAGTATPATAVSLPQSIMLGFSASLIGEPVNVLLLVDERAHDDFAPLVVEQLVNDRFEAIALRDTTRALGESGLLSMSFPVKPSPRDLFGQTLTWLRLRPSRRSPTAAWQPIIRGAYLNAAWASAAETLTRESLGSSDGRPRLTVQVARPPLLQDSLELRVREPLDDEERQKLLDETPGSVKFNEPDLPGNWVLWRQAPDPNDYGPGERVYALDEQSGEIRFGDGRHGMIPPIDRDSIVAFSYRRTEAAADGQSVPANKVAAHTPLQLVTPVESVEAAFAADQAAGGAPPEDDARVLRFGNARLRHRERALAPADFEDLALQSSRDIAQARAFRTAQGLRLIAVMRGPDPLPNASQRRELKRLLQGSTSPLLGQRDAIVIDRPKVRRLRLRLGLRVASLDDAGRLGEEAKRVLTQLFDSATGGMTESGWPLGIAPTEEDIAYALGSADKLAGIDSIEMVEIDARGAEQPWRPQLRRDELVMLADDALRIRYEPLEVLA